VVLPQANTTHRKISIVERRLIAFLALSLMILIGSIWLENLVHPHVPNPANQVAKNDKDGKAAPKEADKGGKKTS